MKLSEIAVYRGNHTSGRSIYNINTCCIYTDREVDVVAVKALPPMAVNVDLLMGVIVDKKTKILSNKQQYYIDISKTPKVVSVKPIVYTTKTTQFSCIIPYTNASISEDGCNIDVTFPKKRSRSLTCCAYGDTNTKIPYKVITQWGYNPLTFLSDNLCEIWGIKTKRQSPLYTIEELQTLTSVEHDKRYVLRDVSTLVEMGIDGDKLEAIEHYGILSRLRLYYFPAHWLDGNIRFGDEQFLRVAHNIVIRTMFQYLNTTDSVTLFKHPWEMDAYTYVRSNKVAIRHLLGKL